jgi:uncharacterized protein YcgI (DUF1989 family)
MKPPDPVRVDHGTARRFELAPGEQIRIATPDGSQGGDFSFVGFDQAVTRNAIGWELHGRPWLAFSADPGSKLYDGDGEPVLEVTAAVGDGRNDIMYPGCWSGVYEDGRPGCRYLISEALGMERRELTGMLSFFVNHSVKDDTYRGLAEVSLSPGDHIELKALRACDCAVSACPDTEIPGWTAGPLEVTVSAGPAS